jgi:hypothetical protein
MHLCIMQYNIYTHTHARAHMHTLEFSIRNLSYSTYIQMNIQHMSNPAQRNIERYEK